MLSLFRRNAPIFHVASMARSGETVFLRSLAAHSQIRVVHNLMAENSDAEAKLFAFLRDYEPTTIPINHPLLKDHGGNKRRALVLKQGVWEHAFPFCGVILARNPAAIYASLRTFEAGMQEKDLDRFWAPMENRLLRWAKGIDLSLAEQIPHLTPIEQFCAFYNRRMQGLAQQAHLPVVHFEQFVTHPKSILDHVLQCWQLPFDQRVLEAHASYDRGQIGHGNIDLGSPISDAPNHKYKAILSRDEFETIADKTGEVAARFGYILGYDKIEIRADQKLPRSTAANKEAA